MYFNKWQANMAASESNPGSSFSLARGYCSISWLKKNDVRFSCHDFTRSETEPKGYLPEGSHTACLLTWIMPS